jgi:hypothetical protein
VCDEDCSAKWSRFISDYPQEEFAAAKKITDSVLKDSVSGYDKVFLLGKFLYKEIGGREGKPQDDLRSSPFDNFEKYTSDHSLKPGSMSLSSVFGYFCWTHDIASRSVDVMKGEEIFALNECYIPELGRWIMVDLNNNILAVRNLTGAFLDFQGVRDSIQKHAPLVVYRATGDSIERDTATLQSLSGVYQNDSPIHYFRRLNMKKINSLRERVSRYFSPDPWYDIFDKNAGSNWPFQVKRVLAILWIISFFVYLISRTKFKI